MSTHSLRTRYMRHFSGLSRYNSLIGRFIVASYFAQIVAALASGHVVLHYTTGWASNALLAFFMVFVATRLRGLNNIVHECSHGSFVEDRAENQLLGSICASVVLGCFKDYRDEHLTHHKHLGDYEHDLDLQGIEDLKLHDPLTPKTIVRHLVTPLIGRHLPYYLGANMSSRDGKGFLALKIALIVSAFIFLAVQPLTALVMVFVPFLLIYSALNYWADCMDHAGLIHSDEELEASRNILAPGLLRWMFFPRSDCFHLVHHLFPQIPARHLEACHQLLEWDADYAARPNAIGRTEDWRKKGRGIVVPAE